MSHNGNLLKFTYDYSLRLLKSITNTDRISNKDDPWRAARQALDEALEKKHMIAADIVSAYNRSHNFHRKLKLASRHLEAVHLWSCRVWPKGQVIKVDAKLVEGSKLLTGGSSGVLQTVFEVGLAWDHILDLPYITGSSLKGAMRAAVEALLDSKHDSIIKQVFGSEAASGCFQVFDAYPVEAPEGLLELDVVTPHYYSRSKVVKSELDAQPVPVVHISIVSGVLFRFVVAHRCSKRVLEDLSKALRELKVNATNSGAIAALLALALLNGVGARTGKGYGMFSLEKLSFDCPRR
ncbi:MAG: type III-B CRISPR module RAMP protein Cmr6 [Desulfurococcales archaeon]|nr:type III-B CRISPR module RAMP protein Cmr6 [Desulfurococcales archaeon]